MKVLICILFLATIILAEEKKSADSSVAKDVKNKGKRSFFGFGYGYPLSTTYHETISFPAYSPVTTYSAVYPSSYYYSAPIVSHLVKPLVHTTYPVTVEKPVPYPVNVPVHIPVDRPVPYPVEKPYPVPVDRPVPYPVHVPTPASYPTEESKAYSGPAEKHSYSYYNQYTSAYPSKY